MLALTVTFYLRVNKIVLIELNNSQTLSASLLVVAGAHGSLSGSVAMVYLAARSESSDSDALVRLFSFAFDNKLPTFQYFHFCNLLCFLTGLAIAKRLMPFGVQRLLYSGRSAKSEAAEVNGEYGKKNGGVITVA